MEFRVKRYIYICATIAFIWTIILALSISTLPGTPRAFLENPISYSGENSLTYPNPSPGTYCYDYTPLYTRTLWADRPSAYSVKEIARNGWKMQDPIELSNVLIRHSRANPMISWESMKTPRSLEKNEGLFFIPQSASFVFTRVYYYKDKSGDSLQTARLGIDYACAGQIFNHIPGASAFCRKDYFQTYQYYYKRWYEKQGLGHCYTDVTPKSYLLSLPDHCYEIMLLLEKSAEKYGKSMPLEWITKDALVHKGYGVTLVDYNLARSYTADYSTYEDCEDIKMKDENTIIQQYISDPALVITI